jgi:hypothetical protein
MSRAENSYSKAKQLHDRNQLQEHYARNSKRSVGIVEYIDEEYSMMRHYIPHCMGVGGLAVVGGLLIMSYNQSNLADFNTAYFSSW